MQNKRSQKEESPLLKGEGIPTYEEITPKEVKESIPILLKRVNLEFNNLEEKLTTSIKEDQSISWDTIMTPLYKISKKLRWSWGVVCHLNAVRNTNELREIHSKYQPEIIRFTNRVGQSSILYKSIKMLQENQVESLDSTQKRILQAEVLSMKQKGVGLEGEDQNRFNINSERLAELSTIFSNNVLDATKEWTLLLSEPKQVKGLPKRTLEVLSTAAKEAGDINHERMESPSAEEGPWRISLDLPNYIAFLTYAEDRSLREKVYKAYVKRASENEFNNEPLIEEILILREEQAKILGYKHWAELSLSSKMARDVEEVENLLEELRFAAFNTAKKEISELHGLAMKNSFPKGESLEPWDISFWSEKLKQDKFNLNQENLRPWFPLPQVLEGLFALCERIFDIHIESADGQVPIWNKDVRFFNVNNNQGKNIASFFLDPYSRPSDKRGGAWMDECITRDISCKENIELPIAYLICNQTPPLDETPSLMSFEEVETLFHEFGHGLQHMLTTINYPQAAGINNIEWDAVELPSQFMENWCLDRSTLMKLAKHWKTGAALPEEEFEKLCLSRKFNSGLATLRQVHFALTDIKLHSQWSKNLNKTPDDLRREIATSTTVIPPIPEDKFLCCFSHIFAGGYGAGYYSYKWAEVLSADAFAAFEEIGLDDKEKVKETGNRFRETILSLGGSKSPKEIFKLFRGREPKTDALIRHSGLLSNH